MLIVPLLQAFRVSLCLFLLLVSCRTLGMSKRASRRDIKDHYRTLGLAKGASSRDIKTAFRKLALQYHPDKNPLENSLNKFIEVAEAYGVLGDKEKRRIYDNKKFRKAGRGARFNLGRFPFVDHYGDNLFWATEMMGRSGGGLFGADGFKDDLFLATSSFVKMGRKGRGGKCKTLSQKTGNIQSTFTQCL